MIRYVMENGLMQAKDINPAVPGMTTKDLTNPRTDDNLDAAQELLTGTAGRKCNPVVYLIAAAVALTAISFLQN